MPQWARLPTPMAQRYLTNSKAILCAVCDRYIRPLAGLPVIVEGKAQIIGFAHRPGCASEKGATRPLFWPENFRCPELS